MAPRPAMSRSLRVTSVNPLVTAVAASRPSMTGIGLIALMRPHWSETALSIPRTRPSNPASTCRSQRSSAAALSGPRGRASSTPLAYLPENERAQKELLVGDRSIPGRNMSVAALALSELRNDVGIDQEAHRSTSRPRSGPRSRSIPSSGADASSSFRLALGGSTKR